MHGWMRIEVRFIMKMKGRILRILEQW